MQVETFEVQEVTEAGKEESSAEAIALCEKLGLTGQLERGATQTGDRSPYRKMTEAEARIYGALCPTRTPLEKYGDEPIPLRVLQVAAHAKELFSELEIWHPYNADVKDPVLVGLKGNSWNKERFILARWGAVLESLETLAIQAVKVRRQDLADALAKVDARLRTDKAALESMTDAEILSVGNSPTYLYELR